MAETVEAPKEVVDTNQIRVSTARYFTMQYNEIYSSHSINTVGVVIQTMKGPTGVNVLIRIKQKIMNHKNTLNPKTGNFLTAFMRDMCASPLVAEYEKCATRVAPTR